MHHAAGTPHWKINTNKNYKRHTDKRTNEQTDVRPDGHTDGRTKKLSNGRTNVWTYVLTDRRTDGHIILPLRGFDPMACGRTGCAQLQAVQMIAKKRCERTDRKTDRHTYG